MASPTAEPSLPDEILEDIFLRLDEAADLARASFSCTSFRRLVSAPRFLRRFRSLHRPPILGCLSSGYPEFQPVDPLHRSAAASAALAQAADFTFSFIEPGNNWSVRDVRDSRVLLAPPDCSQPFESLVVCDPLHRRYANIPPIPGDLLPTSQCRRLRPIEFEPFLAPASEDDDVEGSRLQVICNVLYESKVVTLVFSSDIGKWQAATTVSYEYDDLFKRHYAHNCFYWTSYARNTVLALNPRGMKFSVIGLPSLDKGEDVAIVNAGVDRIGLLTFGSRKHCLEMYTKTMRSIGVGTEGWLHDKTIPLPNCHWVINGGREGYLVLHGIDRAWFEMPQYSKKEPESQYFILELKTLLVERLCAFNPMRHHVYPYESLPPPLSLPSI